MSIQNHTIEPWPVEGAVVIQQPNDPVIREDNYERARLCVDACKGIPTEVLREAFTLMLSVTNQEGVIVDYYERVKEPEEVYHDGEKRTEQEGSLD